jgi:tRNA(Met) cytidine acetyltransferase
LVDLLKGVQSALDAARLRRHRTALVLSGPRDECMQSVAGLLQGLALAEVYWLGDSAPRQVRKISGTEAFALLGREMDALVFDAWSGFDPDAFGALSGCIRAGGLLILLTPPLEEWPTYADPQNARISVALYRADQVGGRFLQRLATLIHDDTGSLLYETGRGLREPVAAPAEAGQAQEPVPAGPCRTHDQEAAVQALVKVATGHRRRPVVLVSDRGRGKSAAFGIAAAGLIAGGRERIVLTAPRRDAVAAVMEHAERVCPGAGARIRFVAPDELVAHPPAADLVLVDEAAAIPAPLLESILRCYPRVAFATTVHGYEGTGRGFALRFSQVLDRLSNSWKRLQLTTPVRWAPHDPLERLVFRMLALDAEPADGAHFSQVSGFSDMELLKLDRDVLCADEQTLSELFGLLVQAHYRTRPLDLRHLLDGPNLSVYVLMARGHIAATAVVAAEGGFDAAAARAIWAGQSRPHGHLLAETLAAHQGLADAPCLRCGRIVRVAVHPALQRRGLGSGLVAAVSARLQRDGFDYVGTSFGASAALLEFWGAMGWSPVRLSIQKSASSGGHSAVFLYSLSAAGEDLLARARERFFSQFPHQLSDSLRELEPGLVAALLRGGSDFAPEPGDADRHDLQAFAFGQRLVEVSIGALWRLGLHELARGRAQERLGDNELAILVERVLQKRPWPVCTGSIGFSGRRQALQCLRGAVRKLIT